MSRAATFIVTLRTDSAGAHRRLARLLKTALRRDQLRVIDAREIQTSPDCPAETAATATTTKRQPYR
jgi:hypothetical protein